MNTSAIPGALLLALAISARSQQLKPGTNHDSQSAQADIFGVARARGHLRILYVGSSVSCGPPRASSYDKAFPMLVAHGLEKRLGIPVETLNVCYGGSYSVTQLAVLGYEGLPWKPDLVISEIGTLDALNTADSSSAAESIFRVVAGKNIPQIVVYPDTQYAAMPKRPLIRLGKYYGVPVLDIAVWIKATRLPVKDLIPDLVHMNDRGQEIMSDAILEELQYMTANQIAQPQSLPKRLYKPDLDAVHFVPASALIHEATAPLTRFKGAGMAKDCRSGCEEEFTITSNVLVIVFSYNQAPTYTFWQIDEHKWNKLEHPSWLINDTLFLSDKPEAHKFRIRIPSNGQAIAIDGFLLNGDAKPSPSGSAGYR